MAFVRKQGYWVSENGWPMVDTRELDYSAIPGTNFKLGVRIGEPNAILKALIYRLHVEVEPMITSQIGCYTDTNSMPNSNHNSATAIDYNWNLHPWKKRGTWGSKKAKVEKIISDFRGCVEWGGHWSDAYVDEMHFELHFAPGHQGTINLARELWSEGLWGIYKPGGPSLPPAPPVISNPSTFLLKEGSTGEKVRTLQRGLNLVFPRYRDTPLAVDGIYGPRTASAVREFQTRDGRCGPVDGIVGEVTRGRLKIYGIVL